MGTGEEARAGDGAGAAPIRRGAHTVRWVMLGLGAGRSPSLLARRARPANVVTYPAGWNLLSGAAALNVSSVRAGCC